jgi:hypothetical protein
MAMAMTMNTKSWTLSRFGGGYVLELGCGHGLPACYLLHELLINSSNSNKTNNSKT